MLIGLDAIPLTEPLAGVGHYTSELARALARASAADEFELAYPSTYPPLDLFVVDKVKPPSNLKAARVNVGAAGRHWWSLGLPRYVSRRGIQLFHGTNYDVPLWRRCATVLTVHDLSLFTRPETHEARRVWRARRRLPLMARTATLVITPTEAVRREVCAAPRRARRKSLRRPRSRARGLPPARVRGDRRRAPPPRRGRRLPARRRHHRAAQEPARPRPRLRVGRARDDDNNDDRNDTSDRDERSGHEGDAGRTPSRRRRGQGLAQRPALRGGRTLARQGAHRLHRLRHGRRPPRPLLLVPPLRLPLALRRLRPARPRSDAVRRARPRQPHPRALRSRGRRRAPRQPRPPRRDRARHRRTVRKRSRAPPTLRGRPRNAPPNSHGSARPDETLEVYAEASSSFRR